MKNKYLKSRKLNFKLKIKTSERKTKQRKMKFITEKKNTKDKTFPNLMKKKLFKVIKSFQILFQVT